MTAKVDPALGAKWWVDKADSRTLPNSIEIDTEALLRWCRVVLAASEVCSHRDIEKVILDASLMDDIKALAAALEAK